jgi:cytoskeletal protein RodZ
MITIGEVLKKQRKNLNKSIEQVALDTKIQPRFIEYIEADNFEKFDSYVHAQGFIKIYAKYLDLNEDRMLAIYRRTVPYDKQEKLPKRETIAVKHMKFRITPKIVAFSLSILFFLVILSYIGYQIYQFQSPPQIKIVRPENNLTINKEEIEVAGITDSNAKIFINDTPVEITEDGNFKYQVDLNPGVNLITILAKKNNSTQESVETIKINYEAPEPIDQNIAGETEKKNIVRLDIVNSSVWIQLNVDKENKISQIIQAGETYEYEVEDSFSLTTGIINSTKLYFNDKIVPINRGTNSVGSVNCEIINKDQIKCQ